MTQFFEHPILNSPYGESRELVPSNMLTDIDRANYHAFKRSKRMEY